MLAETELYKAKYWVLFSRRLTKDDPKNLILLVVFFKVLELYTESEKATYCTVVSPLDLDVSITDSPK